MLSVLVCEACGSSERRRAVASASARFGFMISTELAPVCGSFRSSRKVATDSTLGLRRCKGLKSNGRRSSSGEASATAKMVSTTIGIR